MLVHESLDSAVRGLEKLAVCYRGDIGRARLVREQRHLTHRFPGSDLADSRLGAIVAQREGAKPAGDHEVEAIARRALLENQCPPRHGDPLDLVLELVERGLVEVAHLLAEHAYDDSSRGPVAAGGPTTRPGNQACQ